MCLCSFPCLEFPSWRHPDPLEVSSQWTRNSEREQKQEKANAHASKEKEHWTKDEDAEAPSWTDKDICFAKA
jgi:hypothetical protein